MHKMFKDSVWIIEFTGTLKVHKFYAYTYNDKKGDRVSRKHQETLKLGSLVIGTILKLDDLSF